jgi:predicted amidophosphoribosyltransferase
MKTQHVQQNQLKLNKKTVNKAVRICVNCGNIAVQIENYGVFCKDCGSFFDVEKEDDE